MNPENPTTALVKTAQSPALARVSNQLALTDKLLAKPEEPFLIPYRKGNKWGFCDRNKNIVIDCVWDWVSTFKDNMAIVVLNSKWGLIHKSGKKITPIKFDGFKFFINSLFRIKINENWVIADVINNKIVSLKYAKIDRLYEGLAQIITIEGKYGYIDEYGNQIILPKYDFAGCFDCHFKCNLIVVGIQQKYGVIDKLGNIIVPLSYDVWPVILSEKLIKVPFYYDSLDQHSRLLNIITNQIFPTKYDMIYSFEEGLACVTSVNGMHGFIDEDGRSIVPPIYDSSNCSSSEGLIAVCSDDKWGFLDMNGDVVINLKYDEVGSFHEGLAAVRLKGKWGLMDTDEELIIPAIYDRVSIDGFKKGLLSVCFNDKWGAINKENLTIVDFEYDSVLSFDQGYSIIEKYKKRGFVNCNGVIIVDPRYTIPSSRLLTLLLLKSPIYPQYEFYDDNNMYYEFCDNIAVVEVNEKAGYINKRGVEYWED